MIFSCITALGTVVALATLITQLIKDHRLKIWEQASKISCWMENGQFYRISTSLAHISNLSESPIYEVVISEDIVSDNKSNVNTNEDYCTYIQCVPPGDYYTEVKSAERGMWKRFDASISFRDIKGKYWCRDACGNLRPLKTSSIDQRNLTRPVSPGRLMRLSDQIEESKKEHDENLRVSVIPQLQYRLDKVTERKLTDENTDILGFLRITNSGIQNALYLDLYSTSMCEGLGRWHIRFNKIEPDIEIMHTIISADFIDFPSRDLDYIIFYSDILNNHYAQCISIVLEYDHCDDELDQLMGKILIGRDFWIYIDKIYAPQYIEGVPTTRDDIKEALSVLKQNLVYCRFDK